MDSLTHTVLGACVGEAIAGKKLGKQAMLWGALANNLPDIDVITAGWMSVPDSLLAHRGFTHSILFAILASPLLAWIFRKLYKDRIPFRTWLFIFGSGNLIHIIIDSLTCYGTAWYEPFHHARVTFNVLFVADPFFTIFLLVSCIALLILRKDARSRKRWANAGMILSTLYVGYALVNKGEVSAHTHDELERQQIDHNDFFTTPTPLNNFLWYLVSRNDTGFHLGYYSVFDKNKEIDFQYLPKNEYLLDPVKDSAEVKALIRFSQGYYIVGKKTDSIVFNDLRFGQVGGWDNPCAPFVFRYLLSKDADNDLVIQQGRIEASKREAIRSLVERIRGKE